MVAMQEVEVISEPGAAVVALDPVRTRLLAELREPASAATLATRGSVCPGRRSTITSRSSRRTAWSSRPRPGSGAG